MQLTLTILGRPVTIECMESAERRLTDLAEALNARCAGTEGDSDDRRRLILAALTLLDETQATSAALARSRMEIERLTDMVVDAKLEAEAAQGGDAAALLAEPRPPHRV